MSVRVDVQYACQREGTPTAAEIEKWVSAALDGRPGGELTVRLVDEEEGLRLNAEYRGGTAPTNVLSFPFDPPPGTDVDLLGDVVVCREVVAREALAQAKPLPHHWAHLVVHGVLHLVGFDHDNEDNAQPMEAEERRILATLGIPDPYCTERAE
ncbi:MAG: rRNA maturation RNase YbeY [Gammaproteobacteria bacterium]|nr:MAG: rRNA maturation RNase YbeY [Gammaproteobacteria bacterium]